MAEAIEALQDEIATLNSNLLKHKEGIAVSQANQPSDTLQSQCVPRATPIKFTFVPGPLGLSTRAEPFDSYDGQYGAGCSWSDFKLVDTGVQFGTFNTISVQKPQPMPCSWQAEIQFTRPFKHQPVVAVWFTGIDMESDRPCHVELNARIVTLRGFDLCISSSEDGVWNSLGVSWAAFPTSEDRYVSSMFDVQVYGTMGNSSGRNTKSHILPEDSPTPQKTILAVRRLAMGCGGTIPFLLSLPYSARRDYICYETTTADKASTGMYVLGVVCITCAKAS